jgi:hypothetical protein
MSEMVFKFKAGARFPGKVDAQLAGERILSLGSTEPEAILEDARPDDSPTHGAFTWDQEEAAHKQHLWEARNLANHIVRIVQLPDGSSVEQPAFVSVVDRESQERRYMPTVQVLEDPDYRDQILLRALNEAISWRKRYDDLHEFARVFAAIDKASQQYHEAQRVRKVAA